MNESYRDALLSLRGLTHPSAQRVAAVRKRLDQSLLPLTPEAAVLTSPTAAAVARVRARLGRRPPAPSPVPAVAAGTLLASALTALAVAASLPEPSRETELVLAHALRSGDTSVGEGVRFDVDGDGELRGTADDISVDWVVGRLVVDVDREDVRAVVRTRDGSLESPAGAARSLVVVRDALGTSVRGAGVATCGGLSEGADAESGVTCWPVTAAGLLGRAVRQSELGTDPASVLASIDAGLAVAEPGSPTQSELLATSLVPLWALGRRAEAERNAIAALEVAPGGARADELLRFAAAAALVRGDCATALPLLSALREPSDVEASHLARCSEGRDQ